jgi:hypothetical protein
MVHKSEQCPGLNARKTALRRAVECEIRGNLHCSMCCGVEARGNKSKGCPGCKRTVECEIKGNVICSMCGTVHC